MRVGHTLQAWSMTERPDARLREAEEFLDELQRVCPEGADDVAVIVGDPRQREQIEVLRSLPDNAGVAAFETAWAAALRNKSHSTDSGSRMPNEEL